MRKTASQSPPPNPSIELLRSLEQRAPGPAAVASPWSPRPELPEALPRQGEPSSRATPYFADRFDSRPPVARLPGEDDPVPRSAAFRAAPARSVPLRQLKAFMLRSAGAKTEVYP